MKRKITLKDIAEAAGVSTTTVSYVMNNHPAISEETKEKVFRVQKELNYVPNVYAQSLRRGKEPPYLTSKNIGFILIESRPYDEIFFPLLKGFSNQTQENNYHPLVLTFQSEIDKNKLPVILRNRAIEGMLITGVLQQETIDFFASLRIPFVILGNYGTGPDVYAVRVDVFNGVLGGLNHLYNLGHREIGLISEIYAYPYHQEVLSGYREFHHRKGLPIKEERILESGRIMEGGYAPTEKMLSLPRVPTAVLVPDHRVGCGVSQTIIRHGLKPGKDISVIVLSEKGMEGFEPELTMMETDTESMARIGVDMLVDILKGISSQPVTVTIPYRLKPGKTCGKKR